MVRTVKSYQMFCYTQGIYIKPIDWVQVELDNWIDEQVKAGILKIRD